jgi:membrane associated rhomboid family serine protease
VTAATLGHVSAARPGEARAPRPVLTAAVFAVTLATSVAALASPVLMQLFTRDLPRLRAGQWWRVVTPLFVQPSGWGQLVFNTVGIAVVGAALQRRLGWAGWSLVYLAGGSGSIAVNSAWHPADTGGGSSAAIAALIGAFLVVDNLERKSGRLEWLAQLYSVFFAVYLTTLDLGGVGASIIAGNATIVVMCIARRAVSRTTLARGSLLVVLAAATAMTLTRDDHGAGLVIGITLAALIRARRAMLSRPAQRRWPLTAVAVPGVVAAAVLTWAAWVHLLGVPLAIAQPDRHVSPVGWSSITLVAATACLAASLALRFLKLRSPTQGARVWAVLCVGVALISVTGPLTQAVGTTSMAALVASRMRDGMTRATTSSWVTSMPRLKPSSVMINPLRLRLSSPSSAANAIPCSNPKPSPT